jgi:hypothetical protein
MVGDNMQQLEIQFFWPLTEQIPLDLDYADCEAPKLSAVKLYSNYAIRNINDITTTFVASNLSIDVDTTVIKTKDEPPFYRKMLYKMMGIKWEKK